VELPEFLLRQLCQPHGWFAPATAWLLNRSNGDQIDRAIAAMDAAANHNVLDIGFGGGRSFRTLLRVCSEGRLAGIDPSDKMVGRARTLWAREIDTKRMQIECGSVASLPWGDGEYDRALTVNTVYFWNDVEDGFREVRRVLRRRGVFLVSILPAEALLRWGYCRQGFRVEEPSFYAEVLRSVGFDEVTVKAAGDRRKSLVVRAVTHTKG
jgi:SAM-dependent methyltransferase